MPNVKLTISRTENGQYLVVADGQGFHHMINARVGVRIKGDDKWFDETLFSIRHGIPTRVLPDGSFVISETVNGNKLNEDWGEDEIYAIADVEGFGEYRSNVVKGRF